jgi:hypothetical protein
MKKRQIHVTFHIEGPAAVEVTCGERVRIDRLRLTRTGPVAERLRELLSPRSTTITLDEGSYFFRTLTEARQQIANGRTGADRGAPRDEPAAPPGGPGAMLDAPKT